jgi:hypothetical protein
LWKYKAKNNNNNNNNNSSNQQILAATGHQRLMVPQSTGIFG